jgi:CRP-like cAMP-binding protein
MDENGIFFQNIERVVVLNSKEKARIAELLRPRKLKRRQLLLQEGDVCQYISFVEQGCLRSYMVDASEREHNLQFAAENDWVTDYCSFYSGKASNQNIEALENTVVLQLSRSIFETLLADVPQLERFFRIRFQQALVVHEKRIYYAMSKTAEERYLEFRKWYGHLEQRIPQLHIASFLGVTPPFLSALRGKLAHPVKNIVIDEG